METKKHEFEKLKREFNSEIGILKGSKGEIKGRITKTDAERTNLENTTGDQLNKVLEPYVYMRID